MVGAQQGFRPLLGKEANDPSVPRENLPQVQARVQAALDAAGIPHAVASVHAGTYDEKKGTITKRWRGRPFAGFYVEVFVSSRVVVPHMRGTRKEAAMGKSKKTKKAAKKGKAKKKPAPKKRAKRVAPAPPPVPSFPGPFDDDGGA